MSKLTVLDLFSGIGGFSLGLERTGGFRTVGFCEIDKYCQQILKQHWPDVPIFEDIHNVTRKSLFQRNIERIDVITAGFPCQPFSQAGKQQGTEDERFLWPQLYRVVERVRPRYVILENVPRLLTIDGGRIFAGILYDFRQIGYDVEWQVISAAALGAWHRRERLWLVAYPHRKRQRSENVWQWARIPYPFGYSEATERRWHELKPRTCAVRSNVPNAPHGRFIGWQRGKRANCKVSGKRLFGNIRSYPNDKQQTLPHANCKGCIPQRFRGRNEAQKPIFSGAISRLIEYRMRYSSTIWKVEPAVGRVVNGIPNRTHRIKALGNAVVPQIPQFIGECILEAIRG